MEYVLTWPKDRHLTPVEGGTWRMCIEPGRLVLVPPHGGAAVVVEGVDELRAFATTVHLAATEYDQRVQHDAAKRSMERRAARVARGGPAGLRHRPVVETPEPPAHMELPA